jgi:outer membrane protein assembly factor BamB
VTARPRSGIATVLLATTMLGGCWIQPGFGPTRQGFTPFDGGTTNANIGDLEFAWRREVAAFPNRPIVVGQRIVATGSTQVKAFDLHSGSLLWEHDHTNTDDPTYSPQLGDPIWSYDGRIHVPATVFRFGGNFSYDVDTGAVSGGPGTGPVTIGTPAFGPEASVSLSGAFSPAGSLIELRTSGVRGLVHFSTTPTGGPAITDPMLNHDSAWVGAGTHMLRFTLNSCSAIPAPFPPGYCFPTRTLTLSGTARTPAAIDTTRIAMTDMSGDLAVFDAAANAIVWKANVGAIPAPPAVAGETIVVVDHLGGVRAYSADGCGAATCSPLWSADAGAGVRTQPAIAGGVVYVGTADGTVLAFSLAGCGTPSCAPLWTGDANAAGVASSVVAAGPVLADGMVFVMLQNGELVAFARSD